MASGETLQAAVSSPNRTRFVLGITVVMTTDSIDNQEATSLPAHVAIKIPKSIKPVGHIDDITVSKIAKELDVSRLAFLFET